MGKNKKNKLTKNNYFSQEANRLYSGASQLKQFVKCEAEAMAMLNGEIEREEDKTALLQGKYVHAWVEGTLDKFIEEHPEIISSRGATKGELKKDFAICETVIDVLKNDKALMSIITQCDKEQVFTGVLWGLPIKIMVDLLNIDKGYFADLKIMKNIRELYWSNEYKRKVNFIIHWKYDWQMAIYCEILKQNTGEYLTPNIIALSKEDTPNKELITFETEQDDSLKQFLEITLEEMKPHILRVKELKEGKAEPIGCGKCDYCKSKKKITEPIYWLDLGE